MLTMPSDAALLEVWEMGEGEHALDRALTVLAAFTGRSRKELASLGIHRRDALLIACRILAFGTSLEGVSACDKCGCDVELAIELCAPPELEEGGRLELDARQIAFRAPNSYDLALIASCGDRAEGEALLRARCVEGAAAEQAVRSVEAALEALCDPVAIEISTACAACGEPLRPTVEIESFLWCEIAAYAQRLLDDVDQLASRYGWSEREILALSGVRRRHYIEAFA